MDKTNLQVESQRKIFSKGLNGLKWNYIGTFIKMFTQYVVVILLMRVVGPEAYGVMALALSVIALGNLLNDSGLGAFIIQSPQITKDDIRSCFTIQLLMSSLVGLSVFLVSDLIAGFLNSQELAPVLKLLSLGFLLQAFGVISFNLLKKEFFFKKVQLANISSYILGYACLGVYLAFNGWGVWSLVYAHLAQTFLNSAIMYAFTRHSIRLKMVFAKEYIKYFKFGSKALATNIINWVIDSLGTFSMGKVYGSFSLGVYNRTFTLLMYPITFIVNMIQVIMFPLYSKFQNDEKLTQKIFLTTTYVVALFMLPISLICFLFRYEIFEVMFGEYGAECAEIAIPIILSLPFISLTSICSPLFWGRGHVERELKAQIKTVLVYIVLVLIFVNYNFKTFIWVILCVYITRFLIIIISAFDYVSLSPIEYFKSFIPSLKVSLIIMIISIIVKQFNFGNLLSMICLLSVLSIVLGICFLKKKDMYFPPNIEKEFLNKIIKRGE